MKPLTPVPEQTAAPKSQTIELSEGLHLVVSSKQFCTPVHLFKITALSSAMLGNKPVHCTNLLPGISLRIQILQHDLQELGEFVDRLWSDVQPLLESWVEVAEQMPCLNVAIDGVRASFALDRHITLNHGVMRIEAAPVWRDE